MVDLVPDATFVPRMIEVDGDVVLMRTAGSGTSVDGSRAEWEQWVVWRFAAGRAVHGESFSLEDEAAARDRFADRRATRVLPR
jgi:ketosteroid isomerase-like protein